MKPRIKSMIWNIRKQKTTNQNKKKKESKKWGYCKQPLDYFKQSNICLIGMPEGEEEGQEIGNLSEKTVKENFPNLMKEIDMQVLRSAESQFWWMQRGPLQDTSLLKSQRLKIKRDS